VLHSFAGGTSDGCAPNGSVVQDKAGNFYGTTSYCGSGNYGTIWKVSNKGKETILHNFAGGSSDGCNPGAGVTRDSKSNLYGVTYGCGANGYGALYELSTSGTLQSAVQFWRLRRQQLSDRRSASVCQGRAFRKLQRDI